MNIMKIERFLITFIITILMSCISTVSTFACDSYVEATCFDNSFTERELDVVNIDDKNIKISLIEEEYNTSHDDLGFVEHYDAVEPTHDKNGNFEYWYCTKCNKYFTEEELMDGSKIKVEVDEHSIIDYSL